MFNFIGMKKSIKFLIILLAGVFSFTSCEENENNQEEDFSIIGRWHLVGFEQTVMYEFTSTQRHTIYSTNGVFGGLEEAIPNPNPWLIRNDSIVIDLHFGNALVAYPIFRCDGNAVDLVSTTASQTLFRENYDLGLCD